MSDPQLLRLLEQTLGLADQSLTGAELLQNIPNWDSMSTLSFIVMIDRKFGVALKGSRVHACQTVDELLGLVGAAKAKAA
jgi:acyl carrier protein